jgi:hypothetical protein
LLLVGQLAEGSLEVEDTHQACVDVASPPLFPPQARIGGRLCGVDGCAIRGPLADAQNGALQFRFGIAHAAFAEAGNREKTGFAGRRAA